jgi:hypothetical protein
MTTSSAMNISTNGYDNFCDEKCAYSFKYQVSNTCTITNYGSYLYLNYIDSGTVPPVIFNLNKYNVENIEIYSPSLHNFNGQIVEGEIIITHTPVSTGSRLIVCIPISVNGNTTNTATQIITDIITGAYTYPLKYTNPPTSMPLKLNDYTLNSIVPFKPFYFYTGNNNDNIIVYSLENAISVNQSVIDGLQTIISPLDDVKYPKVDYFYMNKYGPSNNDNSEEIYIDCKPTGNSRESEEVEFSKSASKNDLGSLLNSDTLFYIISIIVFIAIIKGMHWLLSKTFS